MNREEILHVFYNTNGNCFYIDENKNYLPVTITACGVYHDNKMTVEIDPDVPSSLLPHVTLLHDDEVRNRLTMEDKHNGTVD